METIVIIPPRAAAPGGPEMLEGWQYRKSVTLSRPSGAVTNYQMKLLIGESSGATGEDVDCGGHCLSNFNDLRFTKSDGVTLLDYWIESITGTTPNQLATIWVEFDSIGTDATTFYMYYGNSGAEAVSSGANTFIKFDDFEWGNDEDNVSNSGGAVTWTIDAGTAKLDTAQKFGGGKSLRLEGTTTTAKFPLPVSNEISISFRFFKEDACNNGPDVSQGDGANRWIVYGNTSENILYYGESPSDSTFICTAGVWQSLEINNINHAAQTFTFNLNGTNTTNASGMYTNASFDDYLRFNGGAGGYWWLDNIMVRNWRSVEPAWGAWGEEETA